LTAHAPPGLEIISVQSTDIRMSAQVHRAFYRVPLPSENASAETLAERIGTFLAGRECWIERQRPKPRRINLRPFVDTLRATGDCIEFALWITTSGAARPDEILVALGLGHVLDAGAVIERTDLEITDELPSDGAEARRVMSAIEKRNTNDRQLPPSHPTAMIGSPMSFDS
jgi:hypothetical protein